MNGTLKVSSWAQIGLFLAVVAGAFVGYGRLEQRVADLQTQRLKSDSVAAEWRAQLEILIAQHAADAANRLKALEDSCVKRVRR